MVALSIQLVSITPSRSVIYTNSQQEEMVVPFYTAGIDYSIPICYILNQQEEMVALSIQLVSITPSRSVIY